MLRNRNIAFFIDVDNVDLTSENFSNIIAQLEGMGAILTGKIYGAKERKHKDIYANAEIKGYKVERPMRIKRRGRKDFDSRIFVDVVDTVCRASSVDAVCVITASCDLVYLYSYLHGKGIKVISSDENEEASSALVDEYVDLGRVYEIELPVPKVTPKKIRPVTRPAVATATRSVARAATKTAARVQESKQQDNTDELLKEIERLKRVAEEQKAEKEAKSKAAEEARLKAEAEAKARAEEREKAQRAIEEAKAKAREEARLEAEAKAREEARLKAIEEAKAKAREEERQRAQKEIEEAKAKAREAAEKAKAEEEARAKAEEEIRLKLAELARSGGNNEDLMKELEKLKNLTSETNLLVKKMNEDPKEKEPKIVVVRDPAKAQEEEKARALAEERARAEERERVQRTIEEAKAKARAEAEARAEERERAQKAIEEAKAQAREEARAEAAKDDKTDELLKQIEHWKSLAEQQSDDTDSPSAKYYMQRTDGKLLRKIEEISKGENDGNDDELLATIQNLLDGLDD